MRSGSGIRILTAFACSIVLGTMPARAQSGGMIVPGRDLKLGAWVAQPQVTQKGAVFQCVVERTLGPGGRKADRLALVIGGGAGWGIQIVRAAWSLDPDKDHDALILVDGGRTVPVESYALDPNRLAIHPSDVPTFEAYLKRGTTMAIRSRSAGIDEGGLPLDGIGAAIDWLDRCGRQFALHGAPPEGAVAKPLAPVGAPVLAAPAPPPPPAPLPGPAQGPIVVTPPSAAVPATAAVVPPPAATAAVPAAIPTAKPIRPSSPTTSVPEPTGSAGKEAGPVAVAPARSDSATAPMNAASGTAAPAAGATSPASAARPPAVAAPSAAAEIRPLALTPAKAVDIARAPAPPPPPVETAGPKALLPTTPAPAEPAAEAIGKVVRGKTDRAAVVARGLPSDGAGPAGASSSTSNRRMIEPVVVRGERGSIVTAVTRPAPEPAPDVSAPPAASTAPPAASTAPPAASTAPPAASTAPPAASTAPSVAPTAPAGPAPSSVAPSVSGAGPTVPSGPVPIGAASAPPAPVGPVRVIQGIAAYPSPYAAPSPSAAPPSGPTGAAAADVGGRVPFDGPVPRAKPR